MDTDYATLLTISLAGLLSNNETERARLLTACETFGFFYLSFENMPLLGWDWKSVDEILEYGVEFFQKPVEKKLSISWDKTGTYYGYKPRGAAVVDQEGTPDSNEFLNISKEDAMKFHCEAYISLGLMSSDVASSVYNFVDQAHRACLVILEGLSKALDVEIGDTLEEKHRIQGRSGDHLRLVQYSFDTKIGRKSDIMLLPHTDFGSLTLLFTDRPGLQVMDPRSHSWKPVNPCHRMAIVNVGDTLWKLTGGLLRSCQHRVVALSSNATNLPLKLSLGYFLRPQDDVLLKPVRSTSILGPEEQEQPVLSKDWIAARENTSKTESYKREKNWNKLKGTAENWV